MATDERVPFVSFLTTAYQTEAYLPATIESVLSQGSPEWELVIVDNGNSDAIAEVVQRYDADPRIRLVRQPNKGYVGGVMAAAEVARGDYYALLDSDDQLTHDYVSTMRAFVDAHPGTAAVGCDAHLFSDERDRPRGRGYLRSVGIDVPAGRGERLSLKNVLRGQVPYYGAVISRHAWQAVGGYLPGAEGVDESVDIWLRLVDRFQTWVIPDRLGRYRVRSNSLSRHPQSVANFESALVNTFLVYAERSEWPEAGTIVDLTVRRLRYHQALRQARWHLTHGDVPDAHEQTRAAWSERRTPRVLLILLLLRVAPGLLVALHPAKQRMTGWAADHVPQRGARRRPPLLRRPRFRKVSVAPPSPASPSSQPSADPRDRPPTSW